MALCIRVCAKRRTRGARTSKPRPSPDARPDWPLAAAGRPAREHTRGARGAGPGGPLEGRSTPDPDPVLLGPWWPRVHLSTSPPLSLSFHFLTLSHRFFLGNEIFIASIVTIQ